MTETRPSPARRMGPEGSATWNLMLDAAEQILREEGYAALTSRRIAERAGTKQQLVYYYFRTMDDLIAEAFRRLSKREIERLEQALGSDRPLRELWGICIHADDAPLIAEFVALANRNKSLSDEVIAFIEYSRRIQMKAITRALKRKKVLAGGLAPSAVAFLATSIALARNREAALGISTGHAEIDVFIEDYLAEFEPEE